MYITCIFCINILNCLLCIRVKKITVYTQRKEFLHSVKTSPIFFLFFFRKLDSNEVTIMNCSGEGAENYSKYDLHIITGIHNLISICIRELFHESHLIV